MFNYQERRIALEAAMDDMAINAFFCPPSADLEYFTGLKRPVPTFGLHSHPHDWLTGALFVPGKPTAFFFPRMTVEFGVPEGLPGEAIVVAESDDPVTAFTQIKSRLVPDATVAIGTTTRAETMLMILNEVRPKTVVSASGLTNRLRRTKSGEELLKIHAACAIVDEVMTEVHQKIEPSVAISDLMAEVDHQMAARGATTSSFQTAVWSSASQLASPDPSRGSTVEEGDTILFDFGAVVDGYCSDFGRTVAVGDVPYSARRAIDVLVDAQTAGLHAAKPGLPVREIHLATRHAVEEAGFGDWFWHRTGHCIGLDLHERPFIDEHEDVLLEPGMTFTIEPSISKPGEAEARIEDVFVCDSKGGTRRINACPSRLPAT